MLIKDPQSESLSLLEQAEGTGQGPCLTHHPPHKRAVLLKNMFEVKLLHLIFLYTNIFFKCPGTLNTMAVVPRAIVPTTVASVLQKPIQSPTPQWCFIHKCHFYKSKYSFNQTEILSDVGDSKYSNEF